MMSMCPQAVLDGAKHQRQVQAELYVREERSAQASPGPSWLVSLPSQRAHTSLANSLIECVVLMMGCSMILAAGLIALGQLSFGTTTV